MGKHRATPPAGPFSRRAASLVVAGAVPLSAVVISAAPAFADAGSADESALSQLPSEAPTMFGEAIAELPNTGVAADRNDVTGSRPVPNQGLAPVDPQALHAPGAAASVPAVAPIEAPEGKLRIGSTQIDRPVFLNDEQSGQINGAAADTEANLARELDSMGFEPSRSDRISADTLGGAAVGAAVGMGVASPLSMTSALVGGVSGLVAGVPFLPIGLVAGPALGAAIGYGVIAAPAAAAGAAVGAAVGAAQGYTAAPIEEAPIAPADAAPIAL
ncbi:hypothetical protein [Nocardia callitridis]|uniref:Uncharacterized protein n=1 Tax=Nocardia callitridis TaxID=648753 RepID=A0ABP9KIY4_9NOCA